MSEPRLIYPEGIDFECTKCGRCCRDRWEIPVDRESADALAKVDWAPHEPRLAGKRLFVLRERAMEVALTPPGSAADPAGVDPARAALATDLARCPYTLAREGEACAFLSADNLCLAHKALGFERKPRVCQQFPFLFTETPDGVVVGLSHACPGVRREPGASLERLEADLRRLHARALRVVRAPERVLLEDGEAPLSWADYLLLEGALTSLLHQGESVEEGLVAGDIYLRMFSDFLVTGVEASDAAGMGAAEREAAPATPAARFVQGWRRLGHGRVLSIARRARPSPRASRALLASFLHAAHEASRRHRGASLLAGFRSLGRQLREAFSFGAGASPALPEPASLAALRRVIYPHREPGIRAVIEQFLAHILFRRRTVPLLGLRVGFALLCLDYALVRWHARALAAAERRSAVTPADAREAVVLVEKYFVTHSRFEDVFLEPRVRGLVHRLAMRRRLVPTLVLTDPSEERTEEE